jgi:uncharacterized repeat protein (TIGR02059 family)
MKKAIIITLLFANFFILHSSVYYVATNGNNSNPGTITQPWATWQKGFTSISPGDILYIRGGTYSPTGTLSNNQFCAVAVDSKKGSSSNMYNVYAYPGETPVLDCRNLTSSYERVGILLYGSDYWYLNGLEITRCDQSSTNGQYSGQGLLLMNSNYNKIEHVTAHHNGGPGLGMRGLCEENLFLNCDSYLNWDEYSDTPGDNADGFDIGFITYRSGSDRVNYLEGCRAWLNGDDGFDMYQASGYHGIYHLTSCWAWQNGYRPDGVTQGGNGCGFKYGDDNSYTDDHKVRRFTFNCIAYANRTRGFSQETADVMMEFYNNISYKNELQGYTFQVYNKADVLRNNISYQNGSADVFTTNQTRDHNSWDSNVTVSNADFESTDGSVLDSPRSADGGLPDISFMHLSANSDLIDKGIDVGLAFSGNAPDLGPFEVQSGSPPPVPVYVSSAVANATPSLLELTYNMTLANIIPAASAFSVLVNSTARTVSKVTISGTKVQLTLSTPVVYGDIITVSYTQPSVNPVQTSLGAMAASIGSQTVSNKVNSIIPVYVSSAVQNATPSILEMTYDQTLANIAPAASAFYVTVNSAARTVNTVAISGVKVQLTLSSSIKSGDIIAVSYTKPATNPLQTSLGGQAAAITSMTVTNNVSAVVPVYVSAAVQNAAPSVLEITYNQTLVNIVPATTAFSVIVNSAARTVNSVVISGVKVQLTLASAIKSGDIITVSYTKPSTNPLQTASGGQAISITSRTVTNNVSAVVPAYVSSAVQNAAPSVLEITYDQTLANIVPAATAFSVAVNSAARTVNSVLISGTKVQLTLSNAIKSGDIITVSYTKPSANPLQTSSGGQAISFTSRTVTNNVSAVIPVYVSSAVLNSAPTVLVMTYDQTLANIVPPVSAFSVLVNSAARTVNSVAISGTKVQLTVSSGIKSGDIISVSYTKPSTNPLQTSSGGQAITILTRTVTNNVIAIIPGYVSSAIQKATPSVLEMTYDQTLANIVPSVSAFSVFVNSVQRTVKSVVISGAKVLLTLSGAVISGDIITVSYTKPSTNPLQTSSGGQAITISRKAVINNVTTVIPVYVSSAVQAATPSVLEMTYNQTLANIVPVSSAFMVAVNSTVRTVNSVAISGNKVLLTLAGAIKYYDVLTVSYTKPASNLLQTASQGPAVSISAQPVTNNVIAVIPVYVSSVIQNTTPSVLEMTYNTILSNTAPVVSAFSVNVNSVITPVRSISITGTKVLLILSNAVKYGDIIKVSYIKPSASALQTLSGGEAVSISDAGVTNNCKDLTKANAAPIIMLTDVPDCSSGFTGEMDATGTYDTDGDYLTYTWTVPDNISVSSTSESKIRFLAPILNTTTVFEFQLNVTDGIDTVSKTIPVNIVPYKPESDIATIKKIESSSYQASDYPDNVTDGSLTTKWSSIGDSQNLLFTFNQPFEISHLEIAFLEGQKYSSFFDIYASTDYVTWEPVIVQDTSCDFSGGFQVFEFPSEKSSTVYSYLKFVGHTNSSDNTNNISELKIFGTPQPVSKTTNSSQRKVIIYPNPARTYFNISIEEPSMNPNSIRILDNTGRIVFDDVFYSGLNTIQLPGNLYSGVYVVELRYSNITLYSQRLIINRQ